MKKILIIISIGLLIYGFSLFNEFLWDIEVMFQKAGIPDGVYFRPAFSAVYSGIYSIFGPNPFFFHLFQLIFHIASAILIYYLFKHFFKETIALILTIIFLVHPSNVETVSFSMPEILFTIVGLIGIFIFIRSKNLSITKIFLSTVILLIALLMKETAIVFFVLVYLYLLLFKKNNKNILINYSIFTVILLMAYFLFRLSGGGLYVQERGLFPIMRISLATRLINIPSIIFYYLKMFFYPMNLAIAQHWVIKSPNFMNFFLPLIYEALLFSGAIFYIIKKKNKIFVFFFLWFLIGLLPHLQIIPLNMTVAERWLYFPMIGLLGMVGMVLNRLKIKNQISKIIFILITITVVFIFSIRSFCRTLDWKNGLILFSHDIKKDSSFDLQNNMGVELFRVGHYNEAKKYFEISTKLAPYWWVNWNNLGAIYEREKNYKKAAEYYQKSINNGQYYLAYENLAKLFVLHSNDQKRTEELLQEALKLYPENNNLRQIAAYYNQNLERPGQ